MGIIGLIGGVIVAMFACKKPLPPIVDDKINQEQKQIILMHCIGCSREFKYEEKKTKKSLSASPLVTQKYPVY